MIMYKTGGYRFPIEKVEITRKTDKSVWYMSETYHGKQKEHRELLMSSYYQWFESFDEAKDYLVSNLESIIEALNGRVSVATAELGRVKELQEKK